MEAGVFSEISLILVIATVVTLVIHALKQPLIIGYILTGILVGPSVLNLLRSGETFELFSSIGIALLLFIVGLGLNPRVMKEVGKVALLTGVGQIVFTSLFGFFLARVLNFETIPALYISVALSFSSTIIILKMLSDKGELSRLYGKIATGFLLVQDIVAVLILVFIAGSNGSGGVGGFLLQTVIKGGLFATAITLLAIYALPKLGSFFARSQEVLFLFSLGWGLGVAAICAALGFSVEIGALAAGVALAATPYSYEISSRMKPLRDFFIILFFIVLGAGMSISGLSSVFIPAIIFSLFILIGNPIIVMAIMGWLGYAKKTSFKAGLVVAQISEFSLVLIVVGSQLGSLNENVVSMMTLIGIITISGCTYMMLQSDNLYKRLEKYLNIFERRSLRYEHPVNDEPEIVLFGFKGGSYNFINTFRKLGKKYLVIDYNPEVIDQLTNEDINCRYGDASDPEFLEEISFAKVKLVIINLTEFESNRLILDHVRFHSQKAVIIAMTKSDKTTHALDLYEKGATYVMMPHYLGSTRISSIIKTRGLSQKNFEGLRNKHTQYLLKHSS